MSYSPDAVVIDANVLIGICAKEINKVLEATAVINEYSASGSLFYAPSVIAAEVLYILCNKRQSGELTESGHARAIKYLEAYMSMILPPPNGDTSLIVRANEILSGYGCSHSTDCLYIALAEDLAKTNEVELLTFDKGLEKQVAHKALSVKVHLLTPLIVN